MIRKIFLVIILCTMMVRALPQDSQKDSGKSPSVTPQALKSADWVTNATIYCVYLRSFSPEGTFAALEQRVPELKQLGVNVIWLMPIHPVGVKHRKGTLGSPYSVRDYYSTNPEFGSIVDFQKLLATVHKNKMKLIIDLVANHTSWDSKLMMQHPEWFTKDSLGSIISPNSDWTDVADLDYSKPGLRNYMLEMMEWWVKDIGIDGFRCDVSEMVPLDFWDEARDRLNKVKPVLMLSEGSLPQQHLNAFDITYSWNLYDILDQLLAGKKSARTLDSLLDKESKQFPNNSLRLRFNTNHDKNAWEAPAVTKFGLDRLKLTTVLINTFPGIPLLYNGEEVANDKKLGLFEKVDIDWSKSHEMDTLWRTLFKLRRDHKSIVHGSFIKIPTSDDKNIYAFSRSEGNDKVFVVLNLSTKKQTVTFDIPDVLAAGRTKSKMKSLFDKSSITLEKGKVLSLQLEPHGYMIYTSEK
jgi:cyclomaltodextrinase / maltogenic alpha-amylase / neopullulanase